MDIKPITKTPSFFIWDFLLLRSSEKLELNIVNVVDKIFHKETTGEMIKGVFLLPGKTSENYWSMLCLTLTNKLWPNQLPSEVMRLTGLKMRHFLNQWNSIFKMLCRLVTLEGFSFLLSQCYFLKKIYFILEREKREREWREGHREREAENLKQTPH